MTMVLLREMTGMLQHWKVSTIYGYLQVGQQKVLVLVVGVPELDSSNY